MITSTKLLRQGCNIRKKNNFVQHGGNSSDTPNSMNSQAATGSSLTKQDQEECQEPQYRVVDTSTVDFLNRNFYCIAMQPKGRPLKEFDNVP